MNFCFYCDASADTKDHVIPQTIGGNNLRWVPACGECNCLLGPRVFEDEFDKGKYIYHKLISRYDNILNIGELDKYRINEVSGQLRGAFNQHNLKLLLILERIVFASKFDLSNPPETMLQSRAWQYWEKISARKAAI